MLLNINKRRSYSCYNNHCIIAGMPGANWKRRDVDWGVGETGCLWSEIWISLPRIWTSKSLLSSI